MIKRAITAVCVLVMLVCLLPVLTIAPKAAENTYLVGYSRVDINPYIDPTLTGSDLVAKSNIMALPLYGSGDVWNRLSTRGLADDNGDGIVDANDGLKVTCICVTDGTGKTVLFITIDLIGGMLVTEIREAICNRVNEELAKGTIDNVILTENQINYAGTHTHTAPAATNYSAAGRTDFNDAGVDLSVVNEHLGIWKARTIANTAEAAIQAIRDRAPAKLVKDQIAASETTSAAVEGRVMNSVRHYYNYDSNGNLICVAGDNFNNRGSDPKQVTPVNDTMYLLKFDFAGHNATSADKKLDIVLVNWRGHPSLNNSSGYGNASSNTISSDYVSAFRYALEQGSKVGANGKCTYPEEQVYRVAFFNGEGGNVNPRGRKVIDGELAGKWIDDLAKANGTSRGIAYGRILCAMAQEGLKTPAHRESVVYSDIETTQHYLYSTRKDTGMTPLGYEAAKAFQALYAQNKNTKLPYVHTSENGEVYVIGSRFHANNLVNCWNTLLNEPIRGFVDLELDAIKLGQNLAFVTSSGEIFDYYYNEDGSNAWKNLDSGIYGTPFIFGYCNGFDSYVANNKAYDYNLGSTEWARGCYEMSISQYTQGTGERMVAAHKQMLDRVFGVAPAAREAYCAHCKETVEWKTLDGNIHLETGHYYLAEDTQYKQLHILQDQQVCFDLNGYTYLGESRAFYTYSNGNAVLSIMDTSSAQTGKVLGFGGNYGGAAGFGGGAILIDQGNTVNLYSGTLSTAETTYHGIQTGGVLRVTGTFNMYGGVITGGLAHNFTGTYLKNNTPTQVERVATGAALYVNGKANIYGGRIESGSFKNVTGSLTGDAQSGYRYTETVEEGSGKAPCIYVSGKLTVAGDAYIEDVYYTPKTTSRFNVNTEDAPFTGYVSLTFGGAMGSNMRIGTCTENAIVKEGSIVLADSELIPTIQGTGIYALAGAAIVSNNGQILYCKSFESACAQYTYEEDAPAYIQLYQNITEDVLLEKTVYLDLNGFDIFGAVTVASGKTLYCSDAKTDDYNVLDGTYGVLRGAISGDVQGAPGYLEVTDTKGVSFHRLQVAVSHVSFRPSVVGMYYTGSFAGDQVVAGQVLEYGIALNAYEAPNEQNIAEGGTSLCVSYTTPWESTSQIAGAMLQNIMKPTNEVMLNISNAGDKVYGRAYIRTADGYIFSDTVSYSLRELVEYADEYKYIQGNAISEMAKLYEQYQPVLDLWNLPRLRMQIAELPQ